MSGGAGAAVSMGARAATAGREAARGGSLSTWGGKARGTNPTVNQTWPRPAVVKVRFDAERVRERIANGHAFEKHVLKNGEYPGVRTRAQFQELVKKTILEGEAKEGRDGRVGFWLDGNFVGYGPNHKDLGTMFRPERGRAYFDDEYN